jgi:antitoxin ParD1/3/4
MGKRTVRMATLTISLPDSMMAFVEAEVAEGDFITASDYFCFLLQEAQKQKEDAPLRTLLLEGLQSGEATPLTKIGRIYAGNWRRADNEVCDNRLFNRQSVLRPPRRRLSRPLPKAERPSSLLRVCGRRRRRRSRSCSRPRPPAPAG